MRYTIKLLDMPKPNVDIVMTYSDSVGLISTILKEILPAYFIYAVKKYDNNEVKPFFDLSQVVRL